MFFQRLRANHPQLKTNYKNRVSINLNCGLWCTCEMAIEHLDELGSMLIETTGIALTWKNWTRSNEWKDRCYPNLGPLFWTLQFISYQKSKFSRKKVFSGSTGDCYELTKENCECVTIQPFTNSKGDQVLCRVIFSAGGLQPYVSKVCCREDPRSIYSRLLFFKILRLLTSECCASGPQNAGGIYSGLTSIDLIILKKFLVKMYSLSIFAFTNIPFS